MAIHLLTPHFNTSEFFRTSHTDLLDVNRIAFQSDPLYLVRATHIAFILELIRLHVGQPLTITSGFRCNELNKRVGGASRSDHLNMLAVDIQGSIEVLTQIEFCCTFVLPNLFRFVKVYPNKGYIHISFHDTLTFIEIYKSTYRYLICNK